MKNALKKFIYTGVVSALAIAGTTIAVQTSAQDRESAGGNGTLLTQDENGKTVRRHFSFQARRNADGAVTGQANLRNPAFPGDDGKNFFSKIDIKCLRIVGNIAVVGGFVKRTNDANLIDAVVFRVQDNGEPGKNDAISRVFFFDDDPNTTGNPNTICQDETPYPLEVIESGNIQVRGGTTP